MEMKRNRVSWIAALALALAAAWQIGEASAATPCKFAASTPGYGARGNTAALLAGGAVDVSTPASYKTRYLVDVGLWVDADLAAAGADVPAMVLSYFEHANCIFALGVNAVNGTGVHEMSLRIAGNKLRLFRPTSPQVPGQNAYWVQRSHQDWRKAIAALGAAAPKVNLLFSGSRFVDIDKEKTPSGGPPVWVGVGGASNGVGQGQALAQVDVAQYKNGARPFNQDWWGVIAAHELGHALGVDNHLAVQYHTMCCTKAAEYTVERGHKESYRFSVAQDSWTRIAANDAANTDNFVDPYANTPNPVTGEKWSFAQVHRFLAPYNFQEARIWKATGAPCSGAACPGWQPLDDNPATVAIAAGQDQLYQLHARGAIWRYTGTPCSGLQCPGWQKLDQNPRTKAIVTGGGQLYQLHQDGAIWRYTGVPCAGAACPGWQQLDHNPRTIALAAAGNELYQLHQGGAIWRYTGTPCSAAGCPGWQKLDENPRGKAIVAGSGGELYQLHTDGAIWRYTGTPCGPAGCPGWQKLDQNPKTKAITAGFVLYQLHADGAIWRYTGTPCSAAGCPGWQKLDQNARTAEIAAFGNGLYQRHTDGAIWRHTGTPCSATACPGWEKLDANGATRSITAGAALYQLH